MGDEAALAARSPTSASTSSSPPPAWCRPGRRSPSWTSTSATASSPINARGVVATLKHAQVVDGGAIVVVACLNSWRGDPNLTAYAASKHAALGIVRSAALDLGRRGIRVNAVAPGPIATAGDAATRMRRREQEGGMTVEEALARAGEGTALGRIATVDEVADAVHFLADATGITGHLLPVDAGIT